MVDRFLALRWFVDGFKWFSQMEFQVFKFMVDRILSNGRWNLSIRRWFFKYMVDKIKYFKHMVDGFLVFKCVLQMALGCFMYIWWIIFVSIVVNGR